MRNGTTTRRITVGSTWSRVTFSRTREAGIFKPPARAPPASRSSNSRARAHRSDARDNRRCGEVRRRARLADRRRSSWPRQSSCTWPRRAGHRGPNRRIARISCPAQSTEHSAHIGEEVEIHYRWHALYGRFVRRYYGEQRRGSDLVVVEHDLE